MFFPQRKFKEVKRIPQLVFRPQLLNSLQDSDLLPDTLVETTLSFISVWHTNTTLADVCCVWSIIHRAVCLYEGARR